MAPGILRPDAAAAAAAHICIDTSRDAGHTRGVTCPSASSSFLLTCLLWARRVGESPQSARLQQFNPEEKAVSTHSHIHTHTHRVMFYAVLIWRQKNKNVSAEKTEVVVNCKHESMKQRGTVGSAFLYANHIYKQSNILSSFLGQIIPLGITNNAN